MKISKKQLSNIVFAVMIGLLIYPPTKVHLLRWFSFSPSIENKEELIKITNTDWTLKGLNTKNINFNKLEDKVIFISFWATWCPPCIAEMPSMKALFDNYKEKVEFLFITNENWNTVSGFYKKNGYDFPTYNQVSNSPIELKSTTIPATFILSKKNQILVDKKGAANWNSTSIRELLDEHIK